MQTKLISAGTVSMRPATYTAPSVSVATSRSPAAHVTAEKDAYLVNRNKKMQAFLQTSYAVKKAGARQTSSVSQQQNQLQPETLAKTLIGKGLSAKYMTVEQKRMVASRLKDLYEKYKDNSSFLWLHDHQNNKLYLWPTRDNGIGADGKPRDVWLQKNGKNGEYSASAYQANSTDQGVTRGEKISGPNVREKFEEDLGALPRIVEIRDPNAANDSTHVSTDPNGIVGHLQLAALLALKQDDLHGGSLVPPKKGADNATIQWSSRVLNKTHNGQLAEDKRDSICTMFAAAGIRIASADDLPRKRDNNQPS